MSLVKSHLHEPSFGKIEFLKTTFSPGDISRLWANLLSVSVYVKPYNDFQADKVVAQYGISPRQNYSLFCLSQRHAPS